MSAKFVDNRSVRRFNAAADLDALFANLGCSKVAVRYRKLILLPFESLDMFSAPWASQISACCKKLVEACKGPTDFLFAWDKDNLTNSEREGYSAFNALAGFAVAQGVAVTAVAKNEGRTWLVLSIYAIAVCVTMAWTAQLLRSTRQGTDGELRSFDQPSIRHGRFTLFWILVVTLVLIVLGVLGLLPNQTYRNPYTEAIELTPAFYEERLKDQFAGVGGSQNDRDEMDWLWTSLPRDVEGSRLFWLEQKSSFNGHFTNIYLELTYNNTFVVSHRTAFLIKPDRNSVRPNLRQMRFELQPSSLDQTDRFTLVEPDPEERLVIVCCVRPKTIDELKLENKNRKNDADIKTVGLSDAEHVGFSLVKK